VRIIATTTRINSMMCSNGLNRGLRRDDLFILTGWPWISWRNCNSRVGETEFILVSLFLGPESTRRDASHSIYSVVQPIPPSCRFRVVTAEKGQRRGCVDCGGKPLSSWAGR
jgi:hypothetical protein